MEKINEWCAFNLDNFLLTKYWTSNLLWLLQIFDLPFAEEVKTLKEQVVSLRIHLKSKAEEMDQYKVGL